MKIYLACFPGGLREGDVIGVALGEDGQGLTSHLSSNKDFSKYDMGLTSYWKHDHYKATYPEGYELFWIDNPETDERWQKALDLFEKERTDFSSPSNFPAVIVRAIKRGAFAGMGTPQGLLNQPAWAEYEKIRQQAFWGLFADIKNRAEAWK